MFSNRSVSVQPSPPPTDSGTWPDAFSTEMAFVNCAHVFGGLMPAFLNSGTTLYPQQLAASFESLGISCVIEANAGPHTDLLLRALSTGGSMLVCGSQPEADCTIDPSEIIFGRKTMEGFTLSDWLSRTSYARAVQAGLVVQRILSAEVRTESTAKLPLDSYHKALDLMFRGRVNDGQVMFSLLRAT